MFRGKLVACASWTIVGLLCAPAALALQSSIEDLASKNDLSADELRRLDTWINEQVSDLERGIAGNRARAREDFVEELMQVRALGSPGFKSVLAERCSALFPGRIKSANGQLSYALVGALTALGHPAILEGLQSASDSPDAAVRLLAVRGVRQLAEGGRNVEAVPNDRIVPTVLWLSQMGQRETDDVVLAHVYAAFAFPQALDDQARGMLLVLKARHQALLAGRLSGGCAEIVAFDRLARADSARALPPLSQQLADADQVQLVNVVAGLFAVYIDRLLEAEATDRQEDLVRLITRCELLLTVVTGLRCGVTQALEAPEDQRAEKVRAAAAEFLGTSAKKAPLNEGRWQVPVGGGAPGIKFE